MRLYLIRFLLLTLALLALVVALSVIVDPYDYWGTPTIDGVNRYRPASGKHLRAVKLRQYVRGEFNTIVAGNSRVDVGIDPGDSAWPARLRPVYNFGLPGSGTAGVVDTIIRASEIRKPTAIFLAVDFVDFRVSEEEWRRGPSPARESDSALRKAIEVTLSLDAFIDTIRTLAVQHSANPPHILPNGFNRLAEYEDIVATEGHHALFEQRTRESMVNYVRGPKAVWYPGPGDSSEWAALDRIARYAKVNGIALTLFTYPYHAALRLALHESGLGPAYADWLQRLAAFGARTDIPVQYFGTLTPALMESVPAAGDTRTRLAGYWEAGHFKATLGSAMIAAMSAATDRRLHQREIDELLARDAAALDSYARANPNKETRVTR